MKSIKFALGALLLVFASSAMATSMSFVLGDHADGAIYDGSTNPYGLRVDDSGTTFSVGNNLPGGIGGPLILTFDPMDLSSGAVISGTIANNSGGGLWDVFYTLSGLSAAGSGGFVATAGSGTLSEQGGPGLFVLTGKSNGSEVFEFDNDGHRLAGTPGTGWVGRGWVEGDGTNDFLVVGSPAVVPLPAAIWFFGAGLISLVGLRRRATA